MDSSDLKSQAAASISDTHFRFHGGALLLTAEAVEQGPRNAFEAAYLDLEIARDSLASQE